MKFTFYDENTDKEYVIPLNDTDWDIADDGMGQKITDAMKSRQLEERYGIHDCSMGDPEVAAGFTSYEVEDWDSLLEEWKEILSDAGLKPGDVQTVCH